MSAEDEGRDALCAERGTGLAMRRTFGLMLPYEGVQPNKPYKPNQPETI